MTTWRWLPATVERILNPALASMSPGLRGLVERDLEALLANPHDPDLPWADWRGARDTAHPWASRFAVLAEGRAGIRFAVFGDQPYVAVMALVEIPD